MSVSPTNRQMNWTGVAFTPAGGVSTTLNGVTNVDYDRGISLVGFSGDSDQYMTVKTMDLQDPKFTIGLANIKVINSIPGGSRGAFTATHNDAVNGAAPGGGGIIYSTATAIMGSATSSGAHRQFGQGSVVFETWSVDGYTNPVAISAA